MASLFRKKQERYDFKMATVLEETEIAVILPKIGELVSWTADVKEYSRHYRHDCPYGKKKFEEVLGPFIIKSQGKPALVPDSDKRPMINTAYEDFSEN